MRILPFAVALTALSASGEVSFNRDIRPIMSDTCFRCHGPDKSARMAGMRLDIREEALKPTQSGAVPIVPGDPAKSAIIERVFATNPVRIMPPKYAHKDLTPAQKETIRRWVAEGAKYEGHWAYQPVRRPETPEVPNPRQPIRNPIDNFIQARLAREGLEPAAEADRRTLLRRVTLDLTGIPPTPEEFAAFMADRSPDAYEKLVDRLLESPRYAEMQAMRWLDAVRYADTCGFHGDNVFPAWPYRDYVLRAFRNNKPFDEFTREQLAGDLMTDATLDQKIASAYNRLNRTSAEGGLQPKEYLAKYAADRVRTTSAVWLASTIGCAECHDHKFDPFASRDFYSMEAFFGDIQETGLVPDKGPKAWGTQLALPSDAQRASLDKLNHRVGELRWNLAERTAALADRQAEWETATLALYRSGELAWHYQRPVAAASEHGATLTVYNDQPVESNAYEGSTLAPVRAPGDGLVVASGANPDNETYTVTLRPGQGSWTALGVEVITDESLPGVRFARGADRLVVTEVEADLDGRKLPFVLATSVSVPSAEHPAMAAIDGDPRTGWGVTTYGDNGNVFLALRFKEKVATQAGSTLTVRLRHDSEYRRATIGRFRLALSSGEHSWPEPSRRARRNQDDARAGGVPDVVLQALRAPAEKRTAAQRTAIRAHFEWAAPELQPLFVEVEQLAAQAAMVDAAVPRVVVAHSVKPRVMRILPRGNWMDDSGPVVEPAIPGFLGKLETYGRRATRLDLANWIVSRDNPLTARVFVNRTWRQFFGIGLSKVLDDIGSQGEWPVHAELLDWLAAKFMEAWDVRDLIRTIVTSHAYRQSSAVTPTLEERDPDNRLLARQSRYRVDAEVVHDIALSVAGLLVEKFGGPSVRPYQPDGYLSALNFPKRENSASHGDDLYRRGIYTLWQRTFLHPSFQTFDAPTREECTVTRVNSNTPLQALVLLNDPIYVEAERVFAQNILLSGGRSLTRQLDWAFARALNRKPAAPERRILLDLHGKSLARFRAAPGEAKELVAAGEAPRPQQLQPAELAAMTVVARAILNLHETITRN